ncbi:hypothetical protein ALQ65_02049 [Pseudomonas syringae pv. coriandricola]|uniref:Uncharacterized protein n=2 Tax=Pseudomonas syringae group TaxID=136849 RepID=A0A0P9LY21_9PSED|nr:Uncharacterized protein ALO76_00668 [Pseudomonas syringae pv. coriandricola]RMN13115.1 hypothetical protein ALQ65_02049 [Pseudomonas syringae pv. coriandricola]
MLRAFRQATMTHQLEFEIHYQFEGQPHAFLHQTPLMCQSDALHCATLHAGVGAVSGKISGGPIREAILQAKGFGITHVHWRRCMP